jgi:CoA:oxalate CoA-transferase
MTSRLPLEGLLVLEFSQYLSGPVAGLRLADLGARVIKIERPERGDAGRRLSIKDLWTDDSSLLFHTINRNKESFTADLKNADDLVDVKKLIEKADVLTHNFRPGVMEKIGLDYEKVKQINPRIIYGEISGYGKEGPWKNRPGQDLLLQSMSGLAYTTGNAKDNPMPFGLAIADNLCGSQLVQGILGALIRRQKTGKGALIEVSLLESLLDFQFELLTTYHSSGHLPQRSGISNGHPLLHAPYGIYATTDGHIAIAMVDINQLARSIACDELLTYEQKDAFNLRDEIKTILTKHLLTQSSAYCVLEMEQTIQTNGKTITTTRCPIRINGEKIFSAQPAPQLGEHKEKIIEELIKPSKKK